MTRRNKKCIALYGVPLVLLLVTSVSSFLVAWLVSDPKVEHWATIIAGSAAIAGIYAASHIANLASKGGRNDPHGLIRPNTKTNS